MRDEEDEKEEERREVNVRRSKASFDLRQCPFFTAGQAYIYIYIYTHTHMYTRTYSQKHTQGHTAVADRSIVGYRERLTSLTHSSFLPF